MNTEPTKPAQKEEEDSRVRQIVDLGSSVVTNDHGTVHCLTVIGQIEGHGQAPSGTKTTKYEHVLPLLASIEESQEVDGLLVLLHTMGGDVEAGLAIAELIAGMKSRPSRSCWAGDTPSAFRWRWRPGAASSCPPPP